MKNMTFSMSSLVALSLLLIFTVGTGNSNGPLTAIHDIQGLSHISPLNGLLVSTSGIVTAIRSNGFYMQDPNPDSDVATSEGIFVFTSSAPAVAIGEGVMVTGTVIEFRSGGSSSTNLTTTEIGNPGRTVTIVSSGNPLPAPIVIGSAGRIPPATVIEDDATTGNVETSGIFDPANDGIDFYESLEGMLVQVNNAVAVGPTSIFGEIAVIGDNGANAGVRTSRGGIVIRPADFNPERIILSEGIAVLPDANVGDYFQSPIVGIMDYSFGNFKLMVTQTPVPTSGGITQEIATPPPSHKLSVAVFNPGNLSPTDPSNKFATLASQIVDNLKSPDLIAIMEVQDNNGATDDGVVDANTTFNMLISAIQTAGGPTYDYRQINPVNDQDGGPPGGNIRVGFLFRTDRGLSFVDRPGGGPTIATTVVSGVNGPELSNSPGCIDPTNPAFTSSRKPLVGEFTFKGDKVFVIANHFNSKGGDQPLFGHFQPPELFSEAQRIGQAQVVNNFVDSILTLDPGANIIVLGELNDFEFSTPLSTLKGNNLFNLIETLPQEERYTYIFDGNSQALDHILVSNRLFSAPFEFRVVHVNSEFFLQASDHEPLLAFLCIGRICQPPICRTAGFWGTHACPETITLLDDGPIGVITGEDCEQRDGSCAQNITQAVITSCGGCIDACGEDLTNTALGDENSAVEAICVGSTGNITLQLARQLAATALNCCISGSDGTCVGTSIEEIFTACNSVCNARKEAYADNSSLLKGPITAIIGSDTFDCIKALDCYNSGGVPTPGFCATGTCSDNGALCASNKLTLCANPSIATCVPSTDNCRTRDLPLEDLGLTKCTGSDGSLQEGSTGSSNECQAAQNNDCAFLPAPFDPETTQYDCGAKVKVKGAGTVLNQGKECCDTRVNCVDDIGE